MEVLAGITVSNILSAAFRSLIYAYGQYRSIRGKTAQLNLLLNRCADLLLKVEKQIKLGATSSQEDIEVLNSVCACVKDTVSEFAHKGFVWCLLHPCEIDDSISLAEKELADAFQIFNFSAHMSAQRLQSDMEVARKKDTEDLKAKLDELSRNDQQILTALQDRDCQYRRLEELVIGLSKYVQVHGSSLEAQPEGKFILASAGALQRLSKRPVADILNASHWVLTSLEVDIDRSDDACIGRGSFGSIYRGEWSGQVVAVKEMYNEDARSLDPHLLKAFRDEVDIWSRLAHTHILQFFGACLEASQPFIVSRFCPNGNVVQFLRSYPDANRTRLMFEIALGMVYLHGQHIIHADLKGVNILIGDDHKALISDFGLSRLQDEISTTRSFNRQSIGSSRPAGGTLRWMAPECMEGAPASKASDVYSYAMTAWEMFSGEVPFTGRNDCVIGVGVMVRQLRPERPASLTNDALWGIIVNCWSQDPASRPSFPLVHSSIKALLRKNTLPSSPRHEPKLLEEFSTSPVERHMPSMNKVREVKLLGRGVCMVALGDFDIEGPDNMALIKGEMIQHVQETGDKDTMSGFSWDGTRNGTFLSSRVKVMKESLSVNSLIGHLRDEEKDEASDVLNGILLKIRTESPGKHPAAQRFVALDVIPILIEALQVGRSESSKVLCLQILDILVYLAIAYQDATINAGIIGIIKDCISEFTPNETLCSSGVEAMHILRQIVVRHKDDLLREKMHLCLRRVDDIYCGKHKEAHDSLHILEDTRCGKMCFVAKGYQRTSS